MTAPEEAKTPEETDCTCVQPDFTSRYAMFQAKNLSQRMRLQFVRFRCTPAVTRVAELPLKLP